MNVGFDETRRGDFRASPPRVGFSERHSREEALRKTVEWQSLNLGQPSAMSAVYRAEDRVLERRR